jgi:hypothetical protein
MSDFTFLRTYKWALTTTNALWQVVNVHHSGYVINSFVGAGGAAFYQNYVYNRRVVDIENAEESYRASLGRGMLGSCPFGLSRVWSCMCASVRVQVGGTGITRGPRSRRSFTITNGQVRTT